MFTAYSKSLFCFLSFSMSPVWSSDEIFCDDFWGEIVSFLSWGTSLLIFSSNSALSLSIYWALILKLSLMIFFSLSKWLSFLALSNAAFSYFYFCYSHSCLIFSVIFSNWIALFLAYLISLLSNFKFSFYCSSFSRVVII